MVIPEKKVAQMNNKEKNISDVVEIADCKVKLLELNKSKVYILFDSIYFMDLGEYIKNSFIVIESDFVISLKINGVDILIKSSEVLDADVIQSVSVSDEDLTLGGFMNTGEWLEIFVKRYKFSLNNDVCAKKLGV